MTDCTGGREVQGCHPADKPSLRNAAASVILPPIVSLLAIAAQSIWHDYYWGILGGGNYKTRSYPIAYDQVAIPILLASTAAFIFVAFHAYRLSSRRGRGWRLGSGVTILVGGLLLAIAALLMLGGGA